MSADNLALSLGGNFCLTKVALAATGGATATIASTGTITYAIDGIFYTKSALSAQSIAVSITKPDGSVDNGSFTGATNAVAGTSGSVRVYGIYLNSAGTVSVIPGPVCHAGELAAGIRSLQWPAPQKGMVCIGGVRVSLTSGTNFVPGTTNLNAAGLTNAYYDTLVLPGSPLTS